MLIEKVLTWTLILLFPRKFFVIYFKYKVEKAFFAAVQKNEHLSDIYDTITAADSRKPRKLLCLRKYSLTWEIF